MISEAEKKNLVTGFKQTMKALAANNVCKVLLAKDCEDRLSAEIKAAAEKSGAEILYIETMHKLGTLCEIGLGASCAGVLKN